MTRVLVVDDNPDVLIALRLMLEATEFEVAVASDGASALKRLAAQHIDVVLTDLVMSGMDGLSLISSIQRWDAPRPAVIAMTGQVQLAYKANLEAARAVGADAALIKPFMESELRNLIHRLVGGGPALVEDPRRSGSSGTRERRQHPRTPQESQATSIIEEILRDPRDAATVLGNDLDAGGDPKVVGALLMMAVTMASSRGIDIQQRIAQIRRWLRDAGHTV